MDKYKDNIHTCSYPLHVLDTTSCFANIPFIYYFNGPIQTDRLRDSFYKTVCSNFPILVGHLYMDRKGHGRVDVDKDNLNIPDYQESFSNIHYDDLKGANFSWEIMPKDLVTVKFPPTAGKSGAIKLINVHIVSLKDNSGVAMFVSVPHYVMDGNGYSQFMLQWSQVFQQAAQADTAKFSHDRLLLDKAIGNVVTRDVDSATRTPFAYNNPLGRWLAWISPKTRGTMLNIANNFIRVASHVFSVPVSKIRGHGLALSDNDMLSALISLVLSQSSGKRGKKCLVAILVDNRFRLDNNMLVDKRYLGNCLVGRGIQLTTPPGNDITELAQKVRAAVNDTSQSFVTGYTNMLKENPLCFTNLMIYGLSHPNTIVISNLTRLPFYEFGFGGNSPQWISPIPTTFKTFVYILPKQNNKEYNISICTSKSTMKRVLKHPLWQEYTRLVY